MSRRPHERKRRLFRLQGMFGRKDGPSGGKDGYPVCLRAHICVRVHESLAEVAHRIDVLARMHLLEKGHVHGPRLEHVLPQVLCLQPGHDGVKPLGALGMPDRLPVLVEARVVDEGHLGDRR